MSLITTLTRKLVSAPLICLALILGIGSFLWQSSLYQKMLDQIDAELHLTARSFDYLLRIQPTGQVASGDYCAATSAFLEHSAPTVHAALYAQAGDLVCLAGPKSEAQRIPLRTLTDTEQSFSFVSIDSTTHRSLLFKLTGTDGTADYLSLSADFSPFSSQLQRWRFVLLLGSILILAAAALYLRHPRHHQHAGTVARLTELIDQTGADQRPVPFPVEKIQSNELRQLAESYNQMTERLFTGVHRSRQFAAHVAHELRTPLTILRGETEIALRSTRSADDIRQVLESNLEEITRMSYLVDDLLTLSKSDLGEIPLQPKAIRLHELLSDLQRQAQILAREKEISIELECADSDFVIHADELRLRQALLNLLTNAIRYTPIRGIVSINVTTQGTKVTITISDNGIGIDEKHLQHIFERFYRVDKKSHQYDGGTGLGLAIVKWVVDAHRGTVEVSSSPGQGSRFAISLPKNQSTHQYG